MVLEKMSENIAIVEHMVPLGHVMLVYGGV